MSKIIITGATSYIAIALMKKFLQSECLIYAIIRPNSKNTDKIPHNKRIQIIELDMEDINRLSELGGVEKDIDAIYHFAWEGVRGNARNDTKLQHKNCLLTKKCIDVSIAMKIPYFIGIGSWAEYCATNELINETTLLKPVTEYGRKKVEVFNYGEKSCNKSSTKFIWARLFSAYGAGEDSNTLLMQCVKMMRENQTIDLSPCEHMWDYIYIDDVAEALFLLWDKRTASGAYNIAYGCAKKLKEYVIQLKEILGSVSKLNFGSISYCENPQAQMQPDISKLISQTGWQPKIDFESGVTKMLKG